MYEDQLSVDDDMREQWEAARDSKESTEALLATSKSALRDLCHIIDEAMDELAHLAEEHASLSLSGSFSAPLEKAIWLLEQRCKGMEEKGVGLELLTKARSSLEHMKGRLDLLGKATEMQERVQRGRVLRIEGRVQGRIKARDPVQKVEQKVHETVWTTIRKEYGISGRNQGEVKSRNLEINTC